jgi:hypothetical protein
MKMNDKKKLLDIIIELEADVFKRLEIMDKCFNIEENNNEKINAYIDGEKSEYFFEVEDALKDIKIFDTLKGDLVLNIKKLDKMAVGCYDAENQDLIFIICDCLQFIYSIAISIRLKESLSLYQNEIITLNTSLVDTFEKIRIKLNFDFNEKRGIYLGDIEKKLNWLEFDKLSDNNYEKLIMLSNSISFLEKKALANHNKNIPFLDRLTEIADEINDTIELIKEYASERSDELIQINENLFILLNDFDSNIEVDTIELLNKNKELLVESSTGNTVDCIKNNDFEGAIMEFEMTYRYWMHDDGTDGVLTSFLDILDDDSI